MCVNPFCKTAYCKGCKVQPVQTYKIVWSPEGRPIAEVQATSPQAAKREFKRLSKSLRLAHYARYMGEIYAEVA